MNDKLKNLWRYIFPAMGGLFVTYLYNGGRRHIRGPGCGFGGQIIDMSGGHTLSRAMRDMAEDYLFYYCAFSVPMLMSTCLSVFVRNDGSPALSFVGDRKSVV